MEAIIRMRNSMQKSNRKFSDIVTESMFQEICEFTTGQSNYRVVLDEDLYNKGRLLTVEYGNSISYVTLSGENARDGRNSFVQSLPTAIVAYINDSRIEENKSVYYYFLNTIGNINTEYLNFIYRLAATAGVSFINDEEKLGQPIEAFTTIADMHNTRKLTVRSQNNSTYMTKNEEGQIEIYGKTYGANKKETTLFCLAISSIATEEVVLFQVNEGNLSTLPKPDLEAIESKGNIEIIITNESLERREFEQNESLRSPVFIYNLLKIRGEKKCAICDCKIPEIIEGAHIWPVADIKAEYMPFDNKIFFATDGENGIWLCRNHHKLLDTGLIKIEYDGKISILRDQREENFDYISNSINYDLDTSIITEQFLEYHYKRYEYN